MDDKSNEIPAIPRLLELLDITGCLVTIDAIGTQTEIAETIVDRGGDYLLPVKENQGQLFEDMEKLFGIEEQEGFITPGYTYARKVDDNHGRLEIRECWATSTTECLAYLRGRENWKGLSTLAMIRSERRIADKVEIKTRYFISSAQMNAKALLNCAKSLTQNECSVILLIGTYMRIIVIGEQRLEANDDGPTTTQRTE